MAVTLPKTQYLTYQDYLAEPEIMQRYDILDGVREFMTNPTVFHQDIALNIAEMLRAYQRRTRNGKVIMAPCDVLIRLSPLRTRQPDVLYISKERLAQCSDKRDPTPLLVAPELVVEIVSPNETKRRVADKIADYISIGVQECWLVNSDTETVEVLRLTKEGSQTVARYNNTDVLTSQVLPDLQVLVSDIFISE